MTNRANPHSLLNRRGALLSVSTFALAACSNVLGPADANQIIYRLEPATVPTAEAGAPVTWALALDLPDASDSLDTRRIALVKADGTLDYYANAEWPDQLTATVQRALLSAFQASGRVPSLSRTQDALHADYVLGTEIRDFTAHYSQENDGKPDGIPRATVTLIAQISTVHGRKIVANYTASQTAAATANSTAAVVQAFNTALGGAVAGIVAWALALPAPSAGPGVGPG